MVLCIQVDQDVFESTQKLTSHPAMREIHSRVECRFGIRWLEVEWRQLTKPLYSGLGATLKLLMVYPPIPADLNAQARYWKRHYDTGNGTAQDFIDAVEEYEQGKYTASIKYM